MKLLPLKCNKDGVFPFNQLLCAREKPRVLLADTKMGTQWSKQEENFSNLDLQQRDISFRVLGNNKGSLWLGLGAWCCIENDFGTLRRAWIDTLSEAAVYDPIWGQSYIKGGQLFPQTKGPGGEEEVGLKRKIEMTRRISRSVTLCNRWVVGIHLPRKGE